MKNQIWALGVVVILVVIAGYLVSQFSSNDNEDELDHSSTSEIQAEGDAVVPRRGAPGAVSEQVPEAAVVDASRPDEKPVLRQVVITLRESDRTPAFPAEVFISQGEKYYFEGRTDREGIVRCAIGQGPADLLVWTQGALAARELIAADASEQEFVLEHGEEISGSLTVDGALPKKPIDLNLASWGPWASKTMKSLPEDFRDHLPEKVRAFNSAVCRVDLDGKFRFSRLRPGPQTGFLSLSAEYAFSIDSKLERTWDFERGTKAIELHAITLPLLIGRVIERQGGSVVQEAKVSVSFPLDGAPGNTRVATTETDSKGRFRLGVRALEASWAKVSIAHRGAKTEKELEGPFEAIRDLGTLSIDGARDITFKVVDEEGNGLAAAMALVPRARPRLRSKPDGKGGLHTIKGVSYSVKQVEVGSLGFEPRIVDINETSVNPILVRLAPSNRLTIHVVDQEGEALVGRKVAITWEIGEGPFILGQNFPAESLRALGASASGMSQGHRNGGGRTEFQMPKDSTLEIFALNPEVNFMIQAVGLFGRPTRTLGPFKLARAESLEVDLVCDMSRLRDLSFRVLDESGAPIKGATVSLTDREMGRGRGVPTDENGESTHRNVDMKRAELRIEHKDYRNLRFTDHKLRNDSSFEVITLERGLDLKVSVVDHRGELRAASVLSSYKDVSIGATKQDDGTFMLKHQAKRGVEVQAWVGNRKYAKVIDPVSGPVVMTIPEQGALEVSWSLVFLCKYPSLKMSRVEDQEEPVRFRLPIEKGNRTSLPEILPGDYECWIEDYDKAKGKRGTWFDASKRVKLRVEAGKTATLSF